MLSASHGLLSDALVSPDADKLEAMKAARRGELVTAGKPDALLGSLNADC